MYDHILVASHNTEGSRAAEQQALKWVTGGVTITHLVVVPDFWRGMMGDDWLNSGKTRQQFGRYLENQLQTEIQEHIDIFQQQVQAKAGDYHYIVECGDPADCLVKTAKRLNNLQLIIMGSHRPRHMTGFRSRMLHKKIFPQLQVNVLIVPHPHVNP